MVHRVVFDDSWSAVALARAAPAQRARAALQRVTRTSRLIAGPDRDNYSRSLHGRDSVIVLSLARELAFGM
jgi:hypothetical protein